MASTRIDQLSTEQRARYELLKKQLDALGDALDIADRDWQAAPAGRDYDEAQALGKARNAMHDWIEEFDDEFQTLSELAGVA